MSGETYGVRTICGIDLALDVGEDGEVGYMKGFRVRGAAEWDSFTLLAGKNRFEQDTICVIYLNPGQLELRSPTRVVRRGTASKIIPVSSVEDGLRSIREEMVATRDYFAKCVELLDEALRGDS